MPPWMFEILVATVLGLTALAGAGLALVGIPPGVWVAVAIAIGLAAYDSTLVPWSAAIASLVLAALGEGIELASGAVGAKKAGASKTGAFSAMLGGIVGAIAGSFVLPIIGTIIGGLLGAWVGAIVIERGVKDQDWKSASKAGMGAALGRFLSTIVKAVLAVIIAVILVVAVMTT